MHSGATKQNHQQSARPGNQRAKVPSTTNGRLWHSNSCEIQHVHRKTVGQETRKMGHDGTIEGGNHNPLFTGVAIIPLVACNPFVHFQYMGAHLGYILARSHVFHQNGKIYRRTYQHLTVLDIHIHMQKILKRGIY